MSHCFLTYIFLACATMPVMASDDTVPVPPAGDGKQKPAPKDASTGRARYQLLVQRNIFSKDRGRNVSESKTDAKPDGKDAALAPNPEADIVLNGIDLKDGQPAAFLENRKTNAMQIVHVGDTIMKGKITKITLDGIEYTCDISVATIAIGQALDGSVAAPKVASSSSSSGDSHTESGSAGDNAILERLRKKRQEEIRK